MPIRYRKSLIFLFLLSLVQGTQASASSNVVAHVHFVNEKTSEQKSADAGKEPHRKQSAAEHTAARTVFWLTPLNAEARQREQVQHSTLRTFTMAQQGKTFSPHMLVIPVGSMVSFPNKDPFFHNVFSLFNGRRFDLGLYQSGQTRSVAFNRLGVSYIFCNIHPEMSAVILTLDTPYYGSPDEHGGVRISDVPEGTYTLHVWSEATAPEALQLLTRTVTVPASGDTDLGEVRIHTAPAMLSEHLNKFGEAYDPHSTQSSPAY